MYVGFIWTALPFLLSKSGVSIEHISQIAAILYVPPILMFLWAPVVDVKLRRRTWLVAAAAVGATFTCLACPLIGPSYYAALSVLLFLGGSVLAIVYASCGGLMATTLSPSRQGKGDGDNRENKEISTSISPKQAVAFLTRTPSQRSSRLQH
jgi:MFS family permease